MAAENEGKSSPARSPAEIEQDIDRTRAEIDATLDRILERLTPGEMFEQALEYVRSSHGFARFGAAVRDNPLPAVLATVGIGWLLFASMRSGAETVGDERDRRRLPSAGHAHRAAIGSGYAPGVTERATASSTEAESEREAQSIAGGATRTTDRASEPVEPSERPST